MKTETRCLQRLNDIGMNTGKWYCLGITVH